MNSEGENFTETDKNRKKYWIIFRQFSQQVIDHKPFDTRTAIARKYSVVNPRVNLILTREILPKPKGKR